MITINYPNSCSFRQLSITVTILNVIPDFPWHSAKKTILEHLDDVSLLWQVGNRGRDIAHAAGIYKWTDPNISAETVGLATGKRSHIFTQILNVNQGKQGPLVLPDTIEANRSEWISVPELEFYVDFETVSDLSDDFASLPQKGGQPLIFMIGCGHIEDGKWIFRDFTATTLSEPEEVRIIQDWTAHMESVRARISPKTLSPRLIHWSQAETSTLENAYNSAWKRHNKPDWPHLEWFDFLSKVIREEPVVIRGAMGFGLKAISKALYDNTLIHTSWEDGPTDGLGAMAGAWWCHEESKRLNISMSELHLMNDIVSYNEVDCRVMMDIISYLRSNSIDSDTALEPSQYPINHKTCTICHNYIDLHTVLTRCVN